MGSLGPISCQYGVHIGRLLVYLRRQSEDFFHVTLGKRRQHLLKKIYFQSIFSLFSVYFQSIFSALSDAST